MAPMTACPRINEDKSKHSSSDIPKVLETVIALRAREGAIGSTTGYSRSTMERIEALTKMQDYDPDCCVTSDKAASGRLWPDMLQKAALALQVSDVSRCVVADDSAGGLKSAGAAGMWAIGICATGNEAKLALEAWNALTPSARHCSSGPAKTRLRDAGAHCEFDTAADFLPIIEAVKQCLAAGERP